MPRAARVKHVAAGRHDVLHNPVVIRRGFVVDGWGVGKGARSQHPDRWTERPVVHTVAAEPSAFQRTIWWYFPGVVHAVHTPYGY
jgi:hypothetical protein